MAASLDVISNGRLEFGIGAGWNQQECDAYGIDLPPLRQRFDMFDEAVEVIVKLFTDTKADFAGKHYQLTEAYCEPKPMQRPHPPIVIGGGGEKRTLRTVARWAQHWNVPGGGVDVYKQKYDVLRAHCDDDRTRRLRDHDVDPLALRSDERGCVVEEADRVRRGRTRSRDRLPAAAAHARGARAARRGAGSRSPVDPRSTTRTIRGWTTSEACACGRTAFSITSSSKDTRL